MQAMVREEKFPARHFEPQDIHMMEGVYWSSLKN
jgi:hypothetical protein